MPTATLTEITLRALKPPERGQVTYWDTSSAIRGFGIRVSAGGAKTFTLVYGPRRERKTIGRYPTITLAHAREEARRILAEHTLGKFRPQSIAWDEAKRLFIAQCQRKNRPSTVNDYKRLLAKHFPFGRKRLSEISPQDIHRRIDSLADTPSEQRHAFVALKIFFNWAYRKNYVENNPTDRMALHTRAVVRERVLTDSELTTVYKTALDRGDIFANIVALLVLTGQRRGEIAALRRAWIDDAARLIHFPSSITKNKRPHTIPLGAAAAAMIDRVPELGEYLFPASRATSRTGKPTTVFNGWGKCKEEFDRASGVTGWTLHDLRRTFATNLAALSVAPHIVERLLNHASGTISGVAAIYNKFRYMDEMRAAIALWEERLASLLAQHAPANLPPDDAP